MISRSQAFSSCCVGPTLRLFECSDVELLNGLNDLNALSSHLLARRKGIYSRDGFENLDDLIIPRQRRDTFLLLLPHQRRRIDANNFFILFVKLAIFERIANRLPEDLGEFVRRARRQILERSDAPKSPRHGHEPAL